MGGACDNECKAATGRAKIIPLMGAASDVSVALP
jgi:hypothetical protein